MTVVVFRKGVSSEDWKSIFRRTDRMTLLRNDIASLKGKTLSEAERDSFDEKTIEVGEILFGLYEEATAYLFNWGEVETCSFTDEEFPALFCRPQYEIYGPNPLAGDNPTSVGPLEILPPEPGSRIRGKTLRMRLSARGGATGDYSFELRLRPEGVGFSRYYSGEVIVESGSVFRRGETVQPHYRFGYVEIRFGSGGVP